VKNWDKIEDALNELEDYIIDKAEDLKLAGWSYFPTAKAPESFRDLARSSRNGKIPVANYGCEKTIFKDAHTNVLSRFWHDVTHLEQGLGFSFYEELDVIQRQIDQARADGLSFTARVLLNFDMAGQVYYYDTHREFVKDQYQFVMYCMAYGLDAALEHKF